MASSHERNSVEQVFMRLCSAPPGNPLTKDALRMCTFYAKRNPLQWAVREGLYDALIASGLEDEANALKHPTPPLLYACDEGFDEKDEPPPVKEPWLPWLRSFVSRGQ